MSCAEDATSEKLRRRLADAFKAEEWDDCIRLYERLDAETHLTVYEQVRRNYCLQLGSGEVGTLEEAEAALQKALKDAPDYVPAILELGWFYYVVQDDAKEALAYFKRAEELSRDSLAEALRGRNESVEELRFLESIDAAEASS